MKNIVAYTIRYTQKHHQRIAWADDGLYKWDSECDMWIKLTESELIEWVINPSSRNGLYLALTLETTKGE